MTSWSAETRRLLRRNGYKEENDVFVPNDDFYASDEWLEEDDA